MPNFPGPGLVDVSFVHVRSGSLDEVLKASWIAGFGTYLQMTEIDPELRGLVSLYSRWPRMTFPWPLFVSGGGLEKRCLPCSAGPIPKWRTIQTRIAPSLSPDGQRRILDEVVKSVSGTITKAENARTSSDRQCGVSSNALRHRPCFSRPVYQLS